MTLNELMPFSVLVPLIAAPICALLPGRFLPWLLAMLATLCSAVIMAQVLPAAIDEPIRYAFGQWAPPIGIEFRTDAVNGFIGLLVSVMAVVILPWARISVNQEVPENQGLFYALFLLAFSGLMGMTMTGDAFNLFVFLEISSLSTYALVAQGRAKAAPLSAFRYLIMGTLGATFYLIGVGLIYIMTGTLNMLDLAERLPEVADTRAVQAAFGFILVGVGVKLALFPLHRWLPGAYANAPSAITVFLSSTATKVAVYVVLRLVFTVFGVDFASSMPYGEIFFILGLVGILLPSVWAIEQDNVKRLLAYSSVAQVGYIILAISLLSVTGLAAGLVHLFNHAVIKAALFMCVCTVIYQTGSARIEAFQGLGRQMPLTMLAFVLAGLSLIGVPLTAGFISKWVLIEAAIAQGLWLAVAVVLIGSLLAVMYIGKVAEAAWLKPAPEGRPPVREARLGLLLPMWILIVANFYFGIDTRLTLDVAYEGARILLGGQP
ncbi:monovalent cation/H+ antiporter subunit D family protein [Wenzhouxiangella marina]|uniref:Monovalent cation/H+ antiporter subunit D n=1 Tax=Wenzhouxiangella marina TaxID=1579979 RepID=A0A0K0XSV0_9GAMM|nr:monovalent cation/H+ antiporter subunit D family protein [Wenzhouxiangella marina]AKS40763.1 Monovalent cation/H+ antiporter subunit D [Wenzhouxiangella marina]MBB6087636.1 multicomponent Na+:H+ antiporter subunit D [Wenzhouxiangella marina]